MSSFLTVEELKTHPLPVTDAQWAKVTDTKLESVIEAASDHLEDYMDRRILTGNYVDRRRGAGLPRQMLSMYPVQELHAVTGYELNGQAHAYNTSLFYVDEEAGILEWKDQTRNIFYKNYTWLIDYDAGYLTVPKPIKQATGLQVVKMLQPLFRGGTNFVEVELVTELDEQVIELLDKYRISRFS